MDFKTLRDQLSFLNTLCAGEPASFYAFSKELASRLPDSGEAKDFVDPLQALHAECLLGKFPVSMKWVPPHKCIKHVSRMCHILRELGYLDFANECFEQTGAE
jgi:hypothetical protein